MLTTLLVCVITFTFLQTDEYSTNYYSSGSTERTVLQNFEDIVERSLPLEKVTQYYMESPGAARNVILSYVAFFEERIMV